MEVKDIGPILVFSHSDQDIQTDIDELEKQMKNGDPSGDEYQYDSLQLSKLEIEMQVRKEMEKEDPNFNPETQSGNAALEQRLESDPRYTSILNEIRVDEEEHGAEAASWGIPFSMGKVVQEG